MVLIVINKPLPPNVCYTVYNVSKIHSISVVVIILITGATSL